MQKEVAVTYPEVLSWNLSNGTEENYDKCVRIFHAPTKI